MTFFEEMREEQIEEKRDSNEGKGDKMRDGERETGIESEEERQKCVPTRERRRNSTHQTHEVVVGVLFLRHVELAVGLFADVIRWGGEVGAVLEDVFDQAVALVLEGVAHAHFAGVGAGPEGVVLRGRRRGALWV